MKLSHLFGVNIFIAIFFGGSCAFLPRFVFSLYGLVPDEASVWVTRLVGGSILGFATLMWHGMKGAAAESRRAIALALLVQDTIGFIGSLLFQLKEEVNAFGLFSLGIYGILAIAYSYFLFIRPEKS